MNAEVEIKELCSQIVREFQPDKVILFGSHAYGKPNADSDVDLLVVMPYVGSDARKAAEILVRLNATLPVDLLVRTAEQVRARIEMEDFFMREINERGKVLYEADNARVG